MTISGLDPKNLEFVIWGGDVTLKNLEIRVEPLNRLDLPLRIKSGTFCPLSFSCHFILMMNKVTLENYV